MQSSIHFVQSRTPPSGRPLVIFRYPDGRRGQLRVFSLYILFVLAGSWREIRIANPHCKNCLLSAICFSSISIFRPTHSNVFVRLRKHGYR